jgi:hypothetical protein
MAALFSRGGDYVISTTSGDTTTKPPYPRLARSTAQSSVIPLSVDHSLGNGSRT